ncbi:MAG: putative Ig domain-containing protein, partial [Candidatus Erginobacter occultus]|nr:putative Ig domain-containing protein [Candidatus Erginobacter occultus]
MLVAGCVFLAAGARLFYLIYCGPPAPEIPPDPARSGRSASAEDRKIAPPTARGPNEAETAAVSGEPAAVPSPPAFTIDTVQLPMGVAGEDYRQSLKASGFRGPAVWTIVAGELPPGLDLSPDGVVSGVPEEAGEWRFTVRLSARSG